MIISSHSFLTYFSSAVLIPVNLLLDEKKIYLWHSLTYSTTKASHKALQFLPLFSQLFLLNYLLNYTFWIFKTTFCFCAFAPRGLFLPLSVTITLTSTLPVVASCEVSSHNHYYHHLHSQYLNIKYVFKAFLLMMLFIY